MGYVLSVPLWLGYDSVGGVWDMSCLCHCGWVIIV